MTIEGSKGVFIFLLNFSP